MLAHRLHGQDRAGLPLLLLHAFPLSSWMWHRLVPLLERPALTVDLPGLGASPVPGSDTPVRMSAVADAVVEVMDHHGLEQCEPFGISTGGYAALELAHRHPARTAALVLGSTTPWLVAPDEPAERRRTAGSVRAQRSTEPVADSAREGLGATARREQSELEAALRDLIARTDPDGVTWMAEAIAARSDREETLAGFPGPVRLLFGAEDEATPPARGEQMRAVRAGNPAPTHLNVLPATGHLTALERPAAVAELLRGP
ncbi:alpha/beta fold hydrolase [Nocardioides marmoraquaticus]